MRQDQATWTRQRQHLIDISFFLGIDENSVDRILQFRDVLMRVAFNKRDQPVDARFPEVRSSQLGARVIQLERG